MIPSATDGRCVAGNFVKATVAFLLLLTLVACGGGGGGSSLPIQPINVADNGNNGGPTRTNEVTEMTEAQARAALLEEFSVGEKELALAQEPPPALPSDSDKNLVVIETDDDENSPISRNEIQFEPTTRPTPPEVTDSEVTPEIAARRLRLAPYYAALPAHVPPSVIDHPALVKIEIFRHPRIPAPPDSRKLFPASEKAVEISEWYDNEYIGVTPNGRRLYTYLGKRDPEGRPAIYWHSLEFAALGIWVYRNTPTIGEFHHFYGYTNAGEKAYPAFPSDTDGTREAVYDIEGDAIYRGVNFFPDGALTMDFAVDKLTGHISANGDAANRDDDFGVGAQLPVGANGKRAVTADDAITIKFEGRIDIARDFSYGYRLLNEGADIAASGFFADLDGDTGKDGKAAEDSAGIIGNFYDGRLPNAPPPTLPAEFLPVELAGSFGTNIDGLGGGGGLAANELIIGILGKLRP